MRAIQIAAFGGPEVMQLAELPTPVAGDGAVLIRVTGAGINFADTHARTDDYHVSNRPPYVPGGEVVVVHAAAGGVGSLAVQLAKLAGARVIATASSDEKRALACELGADAAVDPSPEGLCRRLREANDGRMVDVVLEMAGGETFTESFRALGRFGRLVAYGNASRGVASVSSLDIQQHSRSVIGYWLVDCLSDPQRLVAEPLAELFGLVADGKLTPIVGGTYPLADAAQAHLDLEARRTTGKLVLDPVAP